jgi:putative protease
MLDVSIKPSPAPVGVQDAASKGLRRPELLAPAGDWDCARAAVENGADAIYFGLDKFNARIRAHNFTEADLPQLMEFLHRRGVRGYITFNTLVFENELSDAARYLHAIIAAGVDAAIVQDAGICRLIRQISPDFPIHASTQMTVTSAAGVEFARALGCNLVVLARECSVAEIAKINNPSGPGAPAPAENTPHPTMPLEVFVHGALCVAYSGQCLTSEALGGRSANRGECAQACRMPYELVSDGKTVPLGDRKYLLSPQDLAGLEMLPELISAGVASLKIEGRLKSPEYVANITRVYRRALDRLFPQPSTPQSEPARQPDSDRYDLEMGFSRGLHTGWFGGINNQALVHARFGKKRGVFLGHVSRVLQEGVELLLEAPLKPGDGVVFDAGHPEKEEEGGRIYQVYPPPPGQQASRLGFGRGDVDFSQIRVGDKLWKTSDPELERRLRQSFAGDTPRFQQPLTLQVQGRSAEPMFLQARDEQGNVARVESTMPLARAEKQPLTTERLHDQLGRLGGTPFTLGALENELEGEVLLPISELNRMRREVVAKLEQLRTRPKRWQMHSGQAATTSEPAPGLLHSGKTTTSSPSLIVLVRNLEQLAAALSSKACTLYCEFEDPKKYREAVRMVRESPALDDSTSACGTRSPAVFLAPPRIFKTGEEWTLTQIRSCSPDGYLVRNPDHLSFFAGERCIGDFSLNVANRLAAEHFKTRYGLERLTASYDLNFQQLEALLKSTPPEWFEVTIHQHMPMFHMEHCVFCAFLSSGTDYKNCGRPCDTHSVQLRDRVGAEHPVKADAGCRNTVFNARAQTGAEYVEKMVALGVGHFRIEFLNESPSEVSRTLCKYLQLLQGEISGLDLWRQLKLLHQLGVTRGQIAG